MRRVPRVLASTHLVGGRVGWIVERSEDGARDPSCGGDVLSDRGATPRAASVAAPERRPRVVQVSFIPEAERRDPETLLRRVAHARQRRGQRRPRGRAANSSAGRGTRPDDRARRRALRVRGRRTRRAATVARRAAAACAGAPTSSTTSSRSPPTSSTCTASSVRCWRAGSAPRCASVPLLVQDHASGVPDGARRLFWRLAFGDADAVAFAAREQASPSSMRACSAEPRPCSSCSRTRRTSGVGDRDAARAATGLSGDPCVLWTGRLDANKDPLVTLEAFERAARELPDARLWCRFGDAPLLGDVERRIAASPILRDRVALLGHCTHAEMEAHYRAADLFVQASHREGCSYSAIEALACGVSLSSATSPRTGDSSETPARSSPSATRRRSRPPIVEWARRDPQARRAAARARFEQALTYDHVGRDLRDRIRDDDGASMKLAIVTPGGVDESGTERVIPAFLWLIERLARRHDVHVFALSQEPRPRDWTPPRRTGAQRRHRRRRGCCASSGSSRASIASRRSTSCTRSSAAPLCTPSPPRRGSDSPCSRTSPVASS